MDTALTTLRFEGGALGLVDNCRQAVYGYDVRAEVHGSAGKLIIGYEAPHRRDPAAARLRQP